MTRDEERLRKAQRRVGAAMGACLAVWFVPIISGVACNAAESYLIRVLLKVYDCERDEAIDSIFWFIRKKMLFLNAATYAPVAGVPFQLFETYAMGQFALQCVTRPDRISDERWMAEQWKSIESVIFSGTQAVHSYEQFTGKKFPEYAREKFVSTVDTIGAIYRATNKIPGVARIQENAGETIRQGIKLGNRLVDDLSSAAARKWANRSRR